MSVFRQMLRTKIQALEKLLSNIAFCGNKTFIKNQELSNDYFKMNKIIPKFLLTGDKYISVLFLIQQEFTYDDCGPFNRHRERIQKFRNR